MPSAVLLSLVVHAALFLLAGMLVIFTVSKKDEKKFTPPKAVERPKMQLRKPKVKVKKTSPKPTTRIVSKIPRASMPDIQLPEMSGMAAGLVGGMDGFEMMPDLGEISVFGSGQTIGNDFVGTFYDFKRDRLGRTISPSMETGKFQDEVKKFIVSGWKPSKVARYYHSPKKLYATSFMIPPTLSSIAPEAFGEADTLGYCWMALYKGPLVHKEGITFRFRGQGDDILFVRVNGKIVLSNRPDMDNWQSSSADSDKYHLGHWNSIVGDWITLEAGVPQNMEVLFAEVPGGWFYAMLTVEEKGVEYPKNWEGGPILPMFKTTEPTLDLIEAIYGDLVIGEACVTNGPIFRDFDPPSRAIVHDPEITDSPIANLVSNPAEGSRIKTWTGLDGRTFESELVTVIGDKAVLKDIRGKQYKILLSELSEEDRRFIELVNPPEFNMDFSKKSSQKIVEQSPFYGADPPKFIEYVFGAKLKQTSSRVYNHELHVEFFAIGAEIDGDNFILLDRQESTFMPTTENQRSHAFYGKTVTLTEYLTLEQLCRGQKYGGYLITVTDSRGKIIAHQTANEWLFENLENLKKIPLGKHFDKTCTRRSPHRLDRNYFSR